ncbi:ATP-binding cassette domain-containing protein [Curtobacterium sp. S6]|uniref:ABC transporter ATP-binding protein/permease n=1 Tax=Curtobacterium sp. S6 TaxID=1479623 RepID=UPI00068CDD55|nr:ATP-binding cassette domain-containing protein [Curtobacterium sp. S6]
MTPPPTAHAASSRETEPPIVRLHGVGKSFRQGESDIPVLSGLDMELRAGELVAVVGPSGSGKSTLLNILGLLMSADQGEYVLDGADVGGLPRSRKSTERLHRIAFVFQSFHLIDHKNVVKNVELPLKHLGLSGKQRRARAEAMLEQLGLSHRANASVETLSGGEKQRVAIARALVTKPRLLLCDEPTGSLDEERSRDVIAMLRRVTGTEQSTVIVTHDPWVASQCDRALVLDHGRFAETSEPAESTDDREGARVAAAAGIAPGGDSAPARADAEEFSAPESRWPPALDGMAQEETSDSARKPSRTMLAFSEAADAVVHRLRRNLFTVLGVALGVASLVLTVGLTTTISSQLSDAFDIFQAKRVVLSDSARAVTTADQATRLRAGEGYERLHTIHGVTQVAMLQPITGSVPISKAPDLADDWQHEVRADVLGATPEVLDAQGQHLVAGRMFDEGHVQRHDRVAVVGEALLRGLGLTWKPGLTLFVHHTPITVIGVASENPSLADYRGAVYLPLGVEMPQESIGTLNVILATAPGAAAQVGQEAPVAISPEKPGAFAVSVPPEPETLKHAVDQHQRSMLIAVASVTLVIGAVGMMNTYLVAVLERRREIGLRLALGNRPSGILVQFATEAVLTSIVGTIIGMVAAVNTLSWVSLANRWTPVIGADVIGLGVSAGLIIGLLAGLYPAWKASRIDPVETLMQS